jgi:hypothetical protein
MGVRPRLLLLVNVAVGGSFSRRPDSSTTLPQTMLIDHIRVYGPDQPPLRSSTR